MVVLDVAHLFRVFAGPNGLIALLDRYSPNHRLTYNTVQMWGRRGRVPAKWTGAILYICEREGHSCAEFLTDTDELKP